MHKKLKYLLAVLTCLVSWIGMRADNVVTLSEASGSPGEEVTIAVSLTNDDDISAMQISIPLSSNVSLVAGSAKTSTRASGHSATIGVKDGKLQLFVYSSTMTAISGHSGEVMTFKLRLGNEPSIINIAPSALILTDTNGNSVSGTSQDGLISILAPKAVYSTTVLDFGRQPILGEYEQYVTVSNVGSQPLQVTALQFSSDEFSCQEPLPFIVDVNSSQTVAIMYHPKRRGTVSEELKVISNSAYKLNTIKLNATPYAVNELHIEDASGVSDEEVTIHLRVNNMDEISGFQMEFDLPESLIYVDGSFELTDRKQDHQVLATLVGQHLRAICYSLTDKTFTGNDGDIATFRVKLNGQYDTSLKATKVQLTSNIEGKDLNVCSDDYSGYISILSPQWGASRSVDLGRLSVTELDSYSYTIYNNGNAPLIVSRIVMSNEEFEVVSEEMPLTVPAYESREIKIAYKNTSAGKHTGEMRIYCNDPLNRMVNVDLSGTLYSPNFIDLLGGTYTPKSVVELDIMLSNHQKISGMQFDLSYPSGAYTFSNDDIVLGDKMQGFSWIVRNISKGVARVFIYSLSDKVIETDAEKVMSLHLQPIQGKVEEGSYKVAISNLILGNEHLQSVTSEATAETTFMVEVLHGDVNLDGQISISDMAALIGHLKENPTDYDSDCDVNSDGEVNLEDVQALQVLLIGNSQQPGPSSNQPLAVISHGAFIDTGFRPNQDTRVVMHILDSTPLAYWFGCWNYSYCEGAFAMGNDEVNIYNGYDHQGGGDLSIISGEHNVEVDKNLVKIDGEVVRTFSYTPFQTDYTLYLFAQNRQGDAYAPEQTIVMSSCQIYDNGTLIRNFIPYIIGDEIGLYDLLNGQFYSPVNGSLEAIMQ